MYYGVAQGAVEFWSYSVWSRKLVSHFLSCVKDDKCLKVDGIGGKCWKNGDMSEDWLSVLEIVRMIEVMRKAAR